MNTIDPVSSQMGGMCSGVVVLQQDTESRPFTMTRYDTMVGLR